MKILEKNKNSIIVEDGGSINVHSNNEFNRVKIEVYDGKPIYYKSKDIEISEVDTNVFNIKFGTYNVHTHARHGHRISKCLRLFKKGFGMKNISEHNRHLILVDLIDNVLHNKYFSEMYKADRTYKAMEYNTWRDMANYVGIDNDYHPFQMQRWHLESK